MFKNGFEKSDIFQAINFKRSTTVEKKVSIQFCKTLYTLLFLRKS